MTFGDIPYIGSDYKVVDREGHVFHEFRNGDPADDVAPDVCVRKLVGIKAENNVLIVEVE